MLSDGAGVTVGVAIILASTTMSGASALPRHARVPVNIGQPSTPRTALSTSQPSASTTREKLPSRSTSHTNKENTAPLATRGALEEQTRALQQKVSHLEGENTKLKESQLHQSEKEKAGTADSEEEKSTEKNRLKKEKSFAFCVMPWILGSEHDLAKLELAEDYNPSERIILKSEGLTDEEVYEARLALSVWEVKNHYIDKPTTAAFKSVCL
jgi:TolA-binding protein